MEILYKKQGYFHKSFTRMFVGSASNLTLLIYDDLNILSTSCANLYTIFIAFRIQMLLLEFIELVFVFLLI